MAPVLLLMAATLGAPPAAAPDLKLPPGFTARLFADNPLAPDVYTMTLDDAGRVLVAGRGYVRVLVDDDHDGTADRAVDLIAGLKDGPMGLLAEGDSLFVVADGGLKRYRGYNGKDPLKGPPELVLPLKTGGEHDAHAVRRGPDGWLYLLCGNTAGVNTATATGPRSPVKNPIAGALLRLSPDLKTAEVVADGFRNPFSFDFNPDGEPFTYDSDNERCVGLPWYEGCRFLHIVPGGSYGWRAPQLAQTWRKPAHFPDVVRPICDLGRGSPTGVACYRHGQFPDRYRGGFFLADWTFGRIHYVPLTARGSTYEGRAEVFAEATGTSGFAPTALAVHPTTGELFVSIGGRGTRGGVYRIAFDKGPANPKVLPLAGRSLDHDPARAAGWLRDAEPPAREPPTGEEQRRRRHAFEMIARHREHLPRGEPLVAAVEANLGSAEPLVRAAAARAAVALKVPVGDVPPGQPPTAGQLAVALAAAADDPARALRVAFAVLEGPKATGPDLVAALRLVHLAHGDLTAKAAVGTVWEGYTFRDPVPKARAQRLRDSLAALVRRPVGQPRETELEIARLFAVLGGELDTPARRAALDRIRGGTPPADDFHYLIALAASRNGSAPPETHGVAAALLGLHKKATANGATLDRHWPLRLDEVAARFSDTWPGLGGVLLASGAFGEPEHVAFVKPLKLDGAGAAKRFLARAEGDPKYAWAPGVVGLLAELPRAETNAVLEDLWARPGLEEPVLRVLAREPRGPDRPKFVAGLRSLDGDLVRASAEALSRLPAADTHEFYALAIRALRRFPDPKADARTRAAVAAVLQKYTGEKLAADEKAWAAWLVARHPDAAKALDGGDGFDSAAWGKRLGGIAWAKGDAGRGRAVFTRATCAACHDGGRAVGPSLVGITRRFGRDDLLTAVLQPNKDVPPRYRPTRVTTHDEKSYTGVIVYEATDGVILQTGADTTVRIAGADVASKKQVDVSLMPAGLLDKLTDGEIADLLAYLGTLAEPKAK